MSLAAPGEYRASNGLYYRIVGSGEPLLLIHGLMASGAMYDPLIELLQDRFSMLVPDLRCHGQSADVGETCGVEEMAGDLDVVMREANFSRGRVLGYSHGGAVAQQVARTHPDAVSGLFLIVTYAHNAETLREKLEGRAFLALLYLFSSRSLARKILSAETATSLGSAAISKEQAVWIEGVMGVNRAPQMRQAVRGLLSFDSRKWLYELNVPTLVVAGTRDTAVPEHHYKGLMRRIPDARGHRVPGAGHTLLWTHTAELADIVRRQAGEWSA